MKKDQIGTLDVKFSITEIKNLINDINNKNELHWSRDK